MTELFLIAHKVRGEPAFDIATKMVCPICSGEGKVEYEGTFEAEDCPECEGTGLWWIIPTSGHRAYPWEWQPLEACNFPAGTIPELSTVPDHYQHSASPTKAKAAPSFSLADILSSLPKPPPPNIKRRV